MYFWLINSTKKRLIEELRDSFSKNPYYSKIEIQDKFSFKERPQFALVVKGSSGDRIVLSPQNFVGVVKSYCLAATIENHPGSFLEWIREDTKALYDNDHVFPSPPGIYILEVTEVSEELDEGKVVLDVIHSIFDEEVITFETGLETEATLDSEPIAGSLRLHMDATNNFSYLEEGVDYEVDGQVITFLSPFLPNTVILADYKILVDSKGPFTFSSFSSDNEIIPGVVLAFGNQLSVGDKSAIMIMNARGPAFKEYGGHFTIDMDVDAIAVRDSEQSEQINDFAVMSLLKKKSILEGEGLTMANGPSIGGESEEVYDEEGDEYYFTNSFSVSFQTDWAYYEPLPLTVSQVVPTSVYEVVLELPERRQLDIDRFF